MNRARRLAQSLGPGILFASTAIGVSHLVQSTRAGADYGFTFLWAVVIANILKYPFFEFGSRYANATGVSLLEGYQKIGKWMLWLYFGISFISMFIVTAAVTFVTAGLFSNLFGLSISTEWVSLILLVCCCAILLLGNFSVLDGLLKLVGIVLLLSAVAAFVMTLVHGPIQAADGFIPKDAWGNNGQIFMIALMGWMPTAVDISTWNSVWTIEKIKISKARPSMKETLFDFNFGYWLSAGLSICFLTLGAYLMYGSGEELSNSSPAFAAQVVSLFTTSLGDWSYLVIAVAAFSVMFSTTIAVMDGYGRAVGHTFKLLFGGARTIRIYPMVLFLLLIGAFLVISQYLKDLKALVDFATIISFVIAPIIAVVNYVVINSKDVAKEHRPKQLLKVLSYLGIIYLTGFTLYFIWLKLK